MVHAVGPVIGDSLDVGAHRFELDGHIGRQMLDFRVVGHGAGKAQRRLVAC